MIQQLRKDVEAAPFKIVNSEKGDAWIEAKGEKIFSFSNICFYFTKK